MKKLSVLITIALIVAVSFFAVYYHFGSKMVYEQAERGIDRKKLSSFSRYIRDNDVSTKDADILRQWCRKTGKVGIEVFVEEELVYSSFIDVNRIHNRISESGRDKERAVRITFADTEAEVVFYELYGRFGRMVVTDLILSLILFFGIVVSGIRREVAYIHKINEEIHVLEGGDLTKEITIKGSSEITTLAESVDEFRKSMMNQLATIEQLEKSNRRMAAEIAHDMRTPLTSLIMYLDFAQSEIQGKEPQAEEYLNKVREKSVRLKDLMDQNFDYITMKDYFLKEKQEVQAYEILGGYIGDMLTYLEAEGFHVRLDVNYGHCSILIQRNEVGRIFSNLVSNILKYAARDSEVFICCEEEEKYMRIRVVNRIRVFEEGKPESTGFGSRIIRRLLEEMDGEYSAEESGGTYTTTLRFLKA